MRTRGAVNACASRVLYAGRKIMPRVPARMVRGRVLLYHSIGPPDDIVAGYSLRVPPRNFRDQVALLASSFDPVPLSTLVDGEDESFVDGTRPRVALTFDDGYQDVYGSAWDVLLRHGVPFTVFVSTDLLLRREKSPIPALRVEELRHMADEGVEIGSHLCAHRPLALFSASRAWDQLVDSRNMLEDLIGRPVRYLSYPFGGAKDAPVWTRELVRRAGYEAAFSALYGAIPRSPGSRFFLPRVPIVHTDTLSRFRDKARGLCDFMRVFQVARDLILYDPASYHRALQERVPKRALRSPGGV